MSCNSSFNRRKESSWKIIGLRSLNDYLISGSSCTFCHYFEVIYMYKHVVVIRFSIVYVYHRFKSMKCIEEAELDHYNMLMLRH